jgi:hypothetical protein
MRLESLLPRSAAIGLVAVLNGGCEPAEPSSRPPTETPRPVEPAVEQPEPAPFVWRHEFVSAQGVGEFAVLAHGARLLADDRDDAPAWIVGVDAGVVEVVARGDEFIEVQLDWEHDETVGHCVRNPFTNVGLRMFVREDQLADVVVRSTSIEIGEGVGINVAPGTLVLQGRDEVRLWTEDELGHRLELPLALEHAARLPLGKFYAPARADSLRSSLPGLAGEHDRGWLFYGDHQAFISESHRVFARDEADPDHVVLGTACSQVAGRLHPGVDERLGGMLVCESPPEPSWTIAAGVPLRWADGRPAGQTHRELQFSGRTSVKGRARCFTLTLACRESPKICVDADRISEIQASGNSSG